MSSSYRRYAPKRDEMPSTSSTSATRRNLSATGEPSTTGTSWTSLRFNKPMTDGFRGHSSRLASTFEPSRTTNTSSSYAPSMASLSSRYSTTSSTAKEKPSAGYVRSALANYQKAVASSDRPSRPKPSVAGPLMTYRSQVARDMFSPTRFVPSTSSHATTSEREPTTTTTTRSSLANSYLSRTKSPPSSSYLSRTKSPPSRSIFSPARVAPEPDTYSNRSLSAGRPYSFSPASSTASYQPLSRVTSSSLVANPPRRPVSSSYESDQLSLAVTKALNRPTPKADRPWRQKMADAARIRNIHGDDIPSSVVSRLTASRAANRRNSIGQNSGDELQNSLNALKSFVADPMVTDKNSAISKYRARNGNPMEPTTTNSDPRPTAGFTNGPPILPGSVKPYRTSGYGKTLTEAQMSESYAGTPSTKTTSTIPTPMSRSYSPNRSGSTLFETSPRTSYRYPSHESVYHPPPPAPLFRDKGQTIIEEIQERWGESSRRRYPRTSKERTARHNSRQRSLSKEPAKSSSSSEGEENGGGPKKRRDSRDPPKKRRIRKRTSSIPKKQEEKLPPTVMLTDEKNITQVFFIFIHE
uniref:Uncharacterized protein n=1 Tax=Panagrolaimus sp. PS1159 TaxID=55785 RepID=A0AC35FXZ8_9BILA